MPNNSVMPTPEQLFELAQRVSLLERQMGAVGKVLNLSLVPTDTPVNPRNDVGMGPIVTPERSNFV